MSERDSGYLPTPGSMAYKIVRHLLSGPLAYRDLRERIGEGDGKIPVRTTLSSVIDMLRERGLIIRRDPETLKVITKLRVQGRSLLWDLSPEFRMKCQTLYAEEERQKLHGEDAEESESESEDGGASDLIEKPEDMSVEIFAEMIGIRIAATRIIAAAETASVRVSARKIVAAIDRIFEDTE